MYSDTSHSTVNKFTEVKSYKLTGKEPLTNDQVRLSYSIQIDFAKQEVKLVHVLAHTPPSQLFPLLSCLDKNKTATQEPLLGTHHTAHTIIAGSKMFKRMKQNIDCNKTDPLMVLGYGIVAYRDILWYMFLGFSLFSVLSLPALYLFSQGEGYSSEHSGAEIYSLGNLGYSSMQCNQIPVGVGILQISCPYGTIGKVVDFGVNDQSSANQCTTTPLNQQCKPSNPQLSWMLNQAINRQSYVFQFDPNNLWVNETQCQESTNQLFVQFSCIMDINQQNQKFSSLCTVTFFGTITCCLFALLVRWMLQQGKINQIQWDLATCTAADYTVEMPIRKQDYLQWFRTQYTKEGGDADRNISPSLSLKMEMTHYIEECLTQDLKAIKQVNESFGTNSMHGRHLERIKIADIVFSYNNHKAIHALKERGKNIVSQDWEQIRQSENKLQSLLGLWDDLTLPTTAFITFEEEEGAILALQVAKGDSRVLIGQSFGPFYRAPEPSDIIWENRNLTRMQLIGRELIAYGSVGIILLASFVFIYLITLQQIQLSEEFPNVDCQSIQNAYTTQLPSFAYNDYVNWQQNPGIETTGCLQCFCQQQTQLIGETETESLLINGVQICGQFDSSVQFAKLLKSSLKYILIVFNVVLRHIVMSAVSWVGYATETAQLERVTVVTFVCYFFNTAFILMLVNADLSEQPFLQFIHHGSYPDFDSGFFKNIGSTLVGTSLFNSYFPLIYWLGQWLIRFLLRFYDRSWSLTNTYNTKKTALQSYVDLYSGSVFMIHYKYSAILNISFVTMMFGFGIPLLFPIAMLSFLLMFSLERFLLYYSYRLPPMYDQRLSELILHLLQLAPIFYLGFGYWMCSSKQLLSNDFLVPVEMIYSTAITQHTMVDVVQPDGWVAPAWPLLLLFWAFVAIQFIGPIVHHHVSKLLPSWVIGDIEVDEDIDNYFAALDEHDRNWSIKEEQNNRKLGVRVLTEEQFGRLHSVPQTKGKTLVGTHSYDILANAKYSDDFQYISANVYNREKFIIDSDSDEATDGAQPNVTRVVLSLGYLTEIEAKGLVLEKRQFAQMQRQKNEMVTYV